MHRYGIVFVPVIRNIFSLSPLNTAQWLIVAAISISPIIIIELQKKLNEVLFGKTVYEYKNENRIYPAFVSENKLEGYKN